MSLPQLIGLDCVICQKGIASVIDGTFCEDCGNPVHRKCLGATHAAGERCPTCGGDPDSPVAIEVQREWDAQDEAAARAQKSVAPSTSMVADSFPVSETCPTCRSSRFTRISPESLVAFAKDRICSDCGTRYTPPTPRWASVIFIILGLVFLLSGTTAIMTKVQGGGWLAPSIFGCIIGATSLLLGIRSLMRPGKV